MATARNTEVRDIRWGASAELVRLANERSSTKKDVYQFGVYTGGSMQGIVRMYTTSATCTALTPSSACRRRLPA